MQIGPKPRNIQEARNLKRVSEVVEKSHEYETFLKTADNKFARHDLNPDPGTVVILDESYTAENVSLYEKGTHAVDADLHESSTRKDLHVIEKWEGGLEFSRKWDSFDNDEETYYDCKDAQGRLTFSINNTNGTISVINVPQNAKFPTYELPQDSFFS